MHGWRQQARTRRRGGCQQGERLDQERQNRLSSMEEARSVAHGRERRFGFRLPFLEKEGLFPCLEAREAVESRGASIRLLLSALRGLDAPSLPWAFTEPLLIEMAAC